MATVNNKFRYQDNRDWDVFRDRLQKLMDSYGINKAELGRRLNMSTSSVCRYFKERTPDITALWRIADLFNTSIDWLIGRSSERYVTLPEKEQDLLNKYKVATPSDKLVIDTILKKYEI